MPEKSEQREDVSQPEVESASVELARRIREAREQLASLEAATDQQASQPTAATSDEVARRIRDLRIELRRLDAAASFAEAAHRDGTRGGEGEQREVRRALPMSFALRADLRERLTKFRDEGGTINVSGICNEAIERELERIESGNAVLQRLRVELTERRGPSWTQGYQAGRNWAETRASWLEISNYATRFTEREVQIVGVGNPGFEEPEFVGAFRPPVQDYGDKASFERADNSYWETKTWECEAFWRAWVRAVYDVYEDNKGALPSLVDQLPPPEIPEPAKRPVDPDEIPF